jgi:hypothetical protein
MFVDLELGAACFLESLLHGVPCLAAKTTSSSTEGHGDPAPEAPTGDVSTIHAA